ncbi:MAG TPA: type IV secretion system protein VirB10 [Steroidobacteraceae bacterium]|nr:type IV secretion system protein VirB10 [Steroidobacteraceae bacterium]
MSREGLADESVPGERSVASVNSERSIQSHVSSVLAAGVMIALGVAALSWYYANALSRQRKAHQAAVTASASAAQGELALPPLGRVPAPPVLRPVESVRPGESAATQAPVVQPPASVAAEMPLTSTPESLETVAPTLDPYRVQARQTVTDRRLSGAAFARDSGQPSIGVAADSPIGSGGGNDNTLAGSGVRGGSARAENALTTLLRPTETSLVLAHALPTQRLLLPKGAFIDCTLETAIDSTLPGMTTCVTATDTFGADGKVVLLERGSKLVGETRGEVQNGAARVFVLWSQARTPAGVIVPLDSPGTDELGRSGLPGEVNRHFWDRFGAALLISVIDGGMQAAVQASSRGNGAIIYNPSTSQDAVTEVLKGSINVPPTVVKHQGERVQVLVARDLDFRAVYELHDTAP